MIIADLFARLGLRVDGKAFSAGEKMIGGLKKGLAALAAYSTVRLGMGIVEDVANTADALDELSQKIGVPVETIQELGYAAGFSGVSTEALGSSLGRLAKTMDMAKRGGKEQRGALRAAGIDMNALAKGTLSLDDAYGQIADKIASMPNGMEKSALAQRIFGRNMGSQLIPALNEGRAGIEALKEEFRASGAEISGDTAKSFAQFNDDQDRLKNTLRGLKVQLVTAVLPGLQMIVTKISAWVKANRALLIEKMTAAMRMLAAVARTLYEVLAPVVRVLYQFTEAALRALDKIGALKYLLVGAAAAVAASWMAALLPFALIGAAIGAVGLLLEDLYQAFTGGDSVIGDAWTRGIDFLRGKFREFFGEIEDRAVALGLIDGKDVISQDLENDYAERTGKGLARINGASDFVASLMTEGQMNPQSFDDLRGGGPSALQTRRDFGAQRRQARVQALQTGASVTLEHLGLGAAVPAAFPRRAAGGAPIPQPTVTVGGITIVAQGADAKEIALRVRQEIEAQIRAIDATSGAKGTP